MISALRKQTWDLEYQVHRKQQQDNEKSRNSMSYRILVMISENNIKLETPRCVAKHAEFYLG
jgi:macrodomain Ter protein organizer (MatP/YcbG family)